VNTKNVNSAAGVILAALTQNRTPAGIALALESAGLLMTPETAADMASVSADAVRVAEESVAELKREHAESARLRGQLAGLESLRLPEKLKVDSIHREYRNGYVHALADMRSALKMPDGITRRIAPTQALREEGACSECGDAPSQWCTGCAKCSCVAEHDLGCAGSAP
jgi:hypothetical protein